MKKHLLAVAVATAIATPVMAQQVSVYGIIGVAAGHSTSGNDNGRMVQTGNGAMSSSRFGLRGVEDLGQGMKATLKLEGSVAADSGQGGGYTGATNGATTLFDRDAFLSLSGGFGEVRLGRQENFVNASIAAVNPTGSNIAGAGYGGSGNNAYGSNVTPSSSSTQNANGTGPQVIASRLNNNIRYISPVFGGFQADVGYVAGEAASTNGNMAATGAGNTTQYGIVFTQGALQVRAGAQEMKLSPDGSSKAKESLVGARYSFGATSVGFSLLETDPNTAGTEDTRKATTISASHALSGTVSVFGSYMSLSEGKSSKGFGSSGTDGDHEANATVIGAKYDMSKRTSLFTIFGTVDNNAYSTYTLHSSAGMPSGSAGKDGKTFLIGAQHSF